MRTLTVLKKGVVAVVAVTTLGLGTGLAGTAVVGAAPAGAATPPANGTIGQSQAAKHFEKHFNCANASRRLGHLQRLQARFTKSLARLDKKLADATKKGDAKVVARWQKAIAHQQRIESHVLGPKAKANAAKVDAMITAKCHVTAPASPAGTTSPTAAITTT